MSNRTVAGQGFSLLAVIGLAVLPGSPPPPPADTGCWSDKLAAALGFRGHEGQANPGVKFLARGPGHAFLVTSTGETDWRMPGGRRIRMMLAGAHPEPVVQGRDALPGRVHYFVGRDPRNWHANVPTYARVEAGQVYPGINLVYYGAGSQLEFDFLIAPGADPNVIRLAFEGTESLRIDS